jgi:hypothetical protein
MRVVFDSYEGSYLSHAGGSGVRRPSINDVISEEINFYIESISVSFGAFNDFLDSRIS